MKKVIKIGRTKFSVRLVESIGFHSTKWYAEIVGPETTKEKALEHFRTLLDKAKS